MGFLCFISNTDLHQSDFPESDTITFRFTTTFITVTSSKKLDFFVMYTMKTCCNEQVFRNHRKVSSIRRVWSMRSQAIHWKLLRYFQRITYYVQVFSLFIFVFTPRRWGLPCGPVGYRYLSFSPLPIASNGLRHRSLRP